MSTMIRVDLHCHSIHSDGTLKPEAVADRLAADQVVFAALVDHDSLDGLAAFRRRLARRGIGFISGVEITCRYRGKAAHLLAYGFDPDHAELRANLDAIVAEPRSRRGKHRRLAPAQAPPRPAGPSWPSCRAPRPAASTWPTASPWSIAPAAALPRPSPFSGTRRGSWRRCCPTLQALGLDGIEAHLSGLSPEAQARLLEMARRRGTAGLRGQRLPPQRHADRHRAARRISGRRFATPSCPAAARRLPAAGRGPRISAAPRAVELHLAHRAVRPSSAMVLFGAVVLDVFLPAFERSLLDRKREMIRELVNSAWGILAEAEQEAQTG